jgi:hypothetical protein
MKTCKSGTHTMTPSYRLRIETKRTPLVEKTAALFTCALAERALSGFDLGLRMGLLPFRIYSTVRSTGFRRIGGASRPATCRLIWRNRLSATSVALDSTDATGTGEKTSTSVLR